MTWHIEYRCLPTIVTFSTKKKSLKLRISIANGHDFSQKLKVILPSQTIVIFHRFSTSSLIHDLHSHIPILIVIDSMKPLLMELEKPLFTNTYSKSIGWVIFLGFREIHFLKNLQHLTIDIKCRATLISGQ